jgi:hypothetical protein
MDDRSHITLKTNAKKEKPQVSKKRRRERRSRKKKEEEEDRRVPWLLRR